MGLIEHSMPAERDRGCSLAERFGSQAAVEADGWTVSGSPTFSSASGVTLDGSSDYLSKALCRTEFNTAALSIVVGFTPDFDADEATSRYLLDADNGAGGNRTIFFHNSGAGTWVLWIGGSLIAAVPNATVKALWNTGESNCLVISGVSGDTSAWLNGTKIIDGDTSAWTLPATISRLTVGAIYNGTSKWSGTIHCVHVYRCQLEDQEAVDICNGATYDYLDGASLILLGNTASHDAANHRVLDVSGNAAHVDLGDGAGSGEPTKLTSHGYSFDGVDDYLGLPALSGAYTASILDRDGWGPLEMTHETAVSVYTDIGTSGAYSRQLMALVVCPEVLTTLQRLDLEWRMRSWSRRA